MHSASWAIKMCMEQHNMDTLVAIRTADESIFYIALRFMRVTTPIIDVRITARVRAANERSPPVKTEKNQRPAFR